MRYPAQLIERFGTAAAFAAVASRHREAPLKASGERRVLEAAAVYMWKRRDVVPHMWRPVVADLLASVSADSPGDPAQDGDAA